MFNKKQKVDEQPVADEQPETPQEPAVEAPASEEAPHDTEAPADAPEPAQAQPDVLEIPKAVTDAYEGVRVADLSGYSKVVMAKASVLSSHDEQRISGEFPTAAEALADAERVVKLQAETPEAELQPKQEEAPQSSTE